jgi:hypothetical protein
MRPVRVMGMQWSAGLIAGMGGVAHVAVTRWWTTRGDFATKMREVEEEVLRITVRKWGQALVHVFDRGYASGNWLEVRRQVSRAFCHPMGQKPFLSHPGRRRKESVANWAREKVSCA